MIDRINGVWYAFHPQGGRAVCRTKRDALRLDHLGRRSDKAMWEYWARALYSPLDYPECKVPAADYS